LHWGHNCISSGFSNSTVSTAEILFIFFLGRSGTPITVITIPALMRKIPKGILKNRIMLNIPPDKSANPRIVVLTPESLVCVGIFETTNSPSFNLNSHLVACARNMVKLM
jgi:hypothetical protein